MSSIFKPGDRVRALRNNPEDAEIAKGQEVTVAKRQSDEAGRFYYFDDSENPERDCPWYGVDEDFELVQDEPRRGATAPIAVSGSILAEALEITQGARNATHGAKERSFKAIAGLWNAYVEGRKEGRDAPLTARNVSDLMVLLKIGRSIQGQPVRDHFVDGAGYAALSGELAAAEAA